jgi:hypothetical protein
MYSTEETEKDHVFLRIVDRLAYIRTGTNKNNCTKLLCIHDY